jgi:folate-binding protein YgfZ
MTPDAHAPLADQHLRRQVEAARTTALAVARPDLATLVVTGKDRLTWLNGLLTCDLAKRAPGEARYGLAVSRSGRVLADVVVLVDEPAERVLVALPSAVAQAVRQHFDHHLVMEEAEMAPRTDAFEPWMLHGPRAAHAAAAAREAGGVAGTLDRTGLGGAFVLAPGEKASEVRAAIARSATIGDEAGWEALRLERAVPRFGADFDDRTYPQEASLEKAAVSFDKGCYLGQEVVCMLEMRGHVKRKLVPLVLDAADPPAPGAPVTDEAGQPVGQVTSAARSPTLGKAVALAMLKRAHAEAGKHVQVGGLRAEVVERPA